MQGAIVRVRIPGYVLKKGIFERIYNIPMLFCLGHQGEKA